ncbi:MAG TPA: YdeI/OmpD-associated family protein [Opitutaceae bacterium]|jgi:uncharacterized protein YdeI (YjbR/CyaY-like superfamily)
MAKNPRVDAYLRAETRWRKESEALRRISLGCGLDEEVKWGKPCYAFEGSNVVLIQGFKEYCALMFFKGVLLKDPDGILSRIGKYMQGPRQARFTDLSQITEAAPVLKKYIQAAIEVERAGEKVVLKRDLVPIPDELEKRFRDSPVLKKAFFELTPGRQRAYIYHISGAKQSATRQSRIEKCQPRILAGKGLLD